MLNKYITNHFLEIGDKVKYNGYIPENIPSYKKDDMVDLIFGKFYEILGISAHYGEYNEFSWYKIKCGYGLKVWFPSVSFDRINNREYIKDKYSLR